MYDFRFQICISAPHAALDRYPRGVAGHVAHPIRSIQISDFRFQISETLRGLHNQRPVLKRGFNGRNNHFYSSSFFRF